MKHLKRLFTGILALLLVASTAMIGVYASNEPDSAPTITVEGREVFFPDQRPVVKNNRTLVPIRFIAEYLGYSVDWDPADNTAIIDNGRIVLYIGTNKAIIDGTQVEMDVASEIMSNRTMVPLRIAAETLGCTVDWFGTNNTVLINPRKSDGSEMSIFERYKQSELFWNYHTAENEYLVWKADYKTLAEASSPDAHHKWWIESPIDKDYLLNQSLDCSIVMRSFNKAELAQVRDILYTPYATQSDEAYKLLLLTIKGELWETFYRETSELYPLYSAIPARSGTFGTRYLDNREVEMYTNNTCTEFIMNISAEGYVNPETPRTLAEYEIDFYTSEAKRTYCLGLWDLDR